MINTNELGDKISIGQPYDVPDDKGRIFPKEVIEKMYGDMVKGNAIIEFTGLDGSWKAVRVHNDDKIVYLDLERC